MVARQLGREELPTMSQPGFFDLDRRLEGISAKGDPLETINAVMP